MARAKLAARPHIGAHHDRIVGVEAAAMQLSAEERSDLIERLIDTVLPPPPLHPAWEAEIARRVAEMDAGLVEGIPAEQVFAKMRAMIEAHDAKG